MGRPSMIRTLRRTLDGKIANNRAIRVVDAKAPAELNSCQVLYVATDNNNGVRQAVAGLRASAALSAGEGGPFLQSAGEVNLMIGGGNMTVEGSLEPRHR